MDSMSRSGLCALTFSPVGGIIIPMMTYPDILWRPFISPKLGRPKKKDRKLVVTSYPRVTLNLVELMARKSMATGRVLGTADVIVESGVSKHIIYRALSGELKEIPFDEIGKLARYFDVPVG